MQDKDLMETAVAMGLTGADAERFVRESQALARSERLEEFNRQKELRLMEAELKKNEAIESEKRREFEEKKREDEIRMREAERQHELDLIRMQLAAAPTREDSRYGVKKSPKLPCFADGQDSIDCYLQRFERFARSNEWPEEDWATSLSALLSGKALEVYSRLSDEDATNYAYLKAALLERYNLNEEGYRQKLRKSKPEEGESPEQYMHRLKSYLNKWITASGVEANFENLVDIIIREQFTENAPGDLKIFIQEREPQNLKDMASVADKFLKAHSKQLHETMVNSKTSDASSKIQEPLQCHNCKKFGHFARNCQNSKANLSVKCEHCDRVGHYKKDCFLLKRMKNAASTYVQENQEEDQPSTGTEE